MRDTPTPGPADAPPPEALALFPLPPASAPTPAPRVLADPKRGARLREAERAQLAWGPVNLDATLPEDHPARAIWALVDQFDLSTLYAQIDARDERAGASAIDPKILLALWVYATSEGEGSAREIWRLTEVHAAYRWLCGGVAVGYHTLSDFRRQQTAVIDALITQVLALLMKHALVDLNRVSQDGTRGRASAGAASFRREATLEERMAQARAHLEAVPREASDPEISARRAAARQRGALDRLARLEAALAQVPEVSATKARRGATDAPVRVSTTDPDARVMKMSDGGVRPAYNIQFATTTDAARVIVGVTATNRGSDQGETTPLLAQIEQRTGVRPTEMRADGGYPAHDALDEAADLGVTVYAPVPTPRTGDTRDPHARRDGDSEAVAAWRGRMASEEAKTIYKARAATSETVNADAKAHRGLDHLAVRGRDKVLGSACLFALTYDILRLIARNV
ncbi:MAG: IS1182 family transposase [Candidatus Rokuibacteriota bacterium]